LLELSLLLFFQLLKRRRYITSCLLPFIRDRKTSLLRHKMPIILHAGRPMHACTRKALISQYASLSRPQLFLQHPVRRRETALAESVIKKPAQDHLFFWANVLPWAVVKFPSLSYFCSCTSWTAAATAAAASTDVHAFFRFRHKRAPCVT
jgi:hypothetical protein